MNDLRADNVGEGADRGVISADRLVIIAQRNADSVFLSFKLVLQFQIAFLAFELRILLDRHQKPRKTARKLILCRLNFLACLGVLAASFLSFPVAILFCFVIFFTASFSGFVIESFSFLSENIGAFYTYSIKWLIQLLPQFDRFNPTKFLVPARLISWSLLAKCALSMVCIKAFLVLIFSLIIFSYREIAKITV